VPYLKCVPCKVRVSATGADTAVADGSCPSCGSALEPVTDLTEVVGFRSPDLLAPASPAEGAERVADISGGKRVAEAQAEIDRWFDEGGSLGLHPLAKAIALEPTQR
jgi:hypothetical protein